MPYTRIIPGREVLGVKLFLAPTAGRSTPLVVTTSLDEWFELRADRSLCLRWDETVPYALDVASVPTLHGARKHATIVDDSRDPVTDESPPTMLTLPTKRQISDTVERLARAWVVDADLEERLTSASKIPFGEFRYTLLNALQRKFSFIPEDAEALYSMQDNSPVLRQDRHDDDDDGEEELGQQLDFGELFWPGWRYDPRPESTCRVSSAVASRLRTHSRHFFQKQRIVDPSRSFGFLIVEAQHRDLQPADRVIEGYSVNDANDKLVDRYPESEHQAEFVVAAAATAKSSECSSDVAVSRYRFYDRAQVWLFEVYVVMGVQSSVVPSEHDDLVTDATLADMQQHDWFCDVGSPVFRVSMERVPFARPLSDKCVVTRYRDREGDALGLILPGSATRTRMILPSALIGQFLYREVYGVETDDEDTMAVYEAAERKRGPEMPKLAPIDLLMHDRSIDWLVLERLSKLWLSWQRGLLLSQADGAKRSM